MRSIILSLFHKWENWSQEKLIYFPGVPIRAQQDRQHLGSAGMQVWSPAQHSGLRIWCCCNWGLECNYSLDLIPGAPYAVGWRKKRKRKKSLKMPRGQEQWNKDIGMLLMFIYLQLAWVSLLFLSIFLIFHIIPYYFYNNKSFPLF